MVATNDRGSFLFRDLPVGRYAVCAEVVHATIPPDAFVGASNDATFAELAKAPFIDVDGVLLILDRALLPQGTGARRLTYRAPCEPRTAGLTSEGLLSLDAGETRNVDVQLSPTPGFRVSGRVVGPSNYKGLLLRLYAADAGDVPFGGRRDLATAIVDRTGRFTFVNVPSGRYAIEPGDSMTSYVPAASGAGAQLTPIGWKEGSIVQAFVTTSPTYVKLDRRNSRGAIEDWGSAVVVVDGDADDVTLTLNSPGELVGRLTWLDAKQQPESSIGIQLESLTGDPSLGLPAANVRTREFTAGGADFNISAIRPGPYLLRLSDSARGWAIRSIRHRGQDFTERPMLWQGGERIDGVVVELVKGPAALSGEILAVAFPGATVTVVVFPFEQDAWQFIGLSPPRLHAIPVTMTGRYSVANVAAGRYYIAALSGALPPDWASPPFLKRLAVIAIERELRWGQQLTLDLTAKALATK
jgi:hypothetical protein